MTTMVHDQALHAAARTFRDADRAWRAARTATREAPKDDDAALTVEIDAHRVRMNAIRGLQRAAKGVK